MAYKNFRTLLAAHQTGKFKGIVWIDNDRIIACTEGADPDGEDDETVFDFLDEGPEGALIQVLKTLGFKAERV